MNLPTRYDNETRGGPFPRWRWMIFLWVTAMTAAGTAAEITLYVAPGGRDRWSGMRAEPTPDRKDGPFATLGRAFETVREVRRNRPGDRVTVVLQDGIYFLDAPLALGPGHSGSSDAPVTVRAAAGARPIVSGGRRITGFRPARFNGKSCWATHVPGVGRDWYFRQLFVRKPGARYFERRYRPAKGMMVVAGLTYSPARKAAPHRAAQKDFRFFPGDIREWRNLNDVEIVALHSWSASRLYIHRVDSVHRIVEFTAMPTFRIGHWYPGGRNPYYADNVAEAFGSPGQWYLDREHAMLYYVPLPGEDPGNLEVVAPRLERLLVLAGKPAGPAGDGTGGKPEFVRWVRFEGIAFCHAAWAPPRTGYDTSQGQPTLPAAIECSWAQHCAFVRCAIAHTGAYAISLGRGCSGNEVRGCRLFDLGGGGVKIGDSRMNRNAQPPELPADNVVENNLIADGGIENFSANAIWAGIVRGAKIRHNEIRNFPYSGIAVGWCWGFARTSAADSHIEYNHIHHVMRLLQDGGGIYTLGQQPGTVIRGNVIHDCFKSPFACNVGQLGIYLDEGSGPFLIEGNIVHDVQMGGFNLHYGAGNTVRNNVFAFIRQDPITCGRKGRDLCYVFEHNIVYLDIPDMLSRRYDPGRARTRFDYNLYFSTAVPHPRFAGRTFDDWRKTGRDRHSRIADPRFVDAGARDFRLRPDSPALAMGIVAPAPGRAGLEAPFRDVDDPGIPRSVPPVYAMRIPRVPPPSPDLDLGFEDVPVGVCPREFHCAGCVKGKGGFAVTDKVARHGKRSLQCIDNGNLRKPFYPYLIRNLRLGSMKSGRVILRFSFRNDPGRPGDVSVEFRDYKNRGAREFLSGPRLRMMPDGSIVAGEKVLGRVPAGMWCEVSIAFAFGPDVPRTYTARFRTEHGEIGETQAPVPDKAFRTPTWLGIISAGTTPCRFWIDDFSLRFSR